MVAPLRCGGISSGHHAGLRGRHTIRRWGVMRHWLASHVHGLRSITRMSTAISRNTSLHWCGVIAPHCRHRVCRRVMMHLRRAHTRVAGMAIAGSLHSARRSIE
jgi:hypothetical protein